MDLTGQLIKIRSDENGRHIIEFATASDVQLQPHQVIIDTSKLGHDEKILHYNTSNTSNDDASLPQQQQIIKLTQQNENMVSEDHTIFLSPMNANSQSELSNNTNIFYGDTQSSVTHQDIYFRDNDMDNGDNETIDNNISNSVIHSSISTINDVDKLDISTLSNGPIIRYGSYTEFKSALVSYESQTITKYILRNQTKSFPNEVCLHDILNNVKNASDVPLIRWEFCAAKDFLPIPFMGVPYITVGKQVFQCHQGKDYNLIKKQQYELKKEILNQATRFKIKTRDKGPSKKLDCPVLFAVRKMYIFPEFPLKEDTKRNRTVVAQKLKKELFKIKSEVCKCKDVQSNVHQNPQNQVIGKLEYLTRFPSDTLHNHDVSKAANFMKLQLKKLGSKGIEILQVKKSAEANPYQYDKHVELITALRASGDLDQLRSARENMCAIYPLSEELWLEWFQDELPLAVIPEQKEYIVSKFELAVKDYASIKVWHEYCQYMMNNIESPSDIERARNVFERAIISVGLHVTEGSSIWDGYREFEIAILDSYQQLQDSGDTVGMDAKVQSQVERIASIFKRQLSIPLLGMADTYKTYEDWSPDTLQDDVRRAYDKASQKLSLCMEYEEKLHNASGSKLAEYYDYIHFESKDGDPTRIQCVYERAIKENCLQHELWGKYTSYLDNKLKIPSIAVNVHERAVRNCPWISKLWQNYIKSLERNGSDYGKVKEAFNQSLKGGFADADSYVKIWLAQCDYHRRRIKDWNIEKENIDEVQKSFESAITYMNHYFGLEGDKYCILLREWAFVEAKYIQDIKRAQELWDTVMKKHSRDANIWLEYIQFLMLFSDSLSIRRAFQRAVQISFEQPEILCEAFIKFERQYGLLAELDDAQLKVDIQLQRVKERREKEALKEAAAEHSNKPENRVNVKKGKKENNMNKDKNIEETNKKKKKLKSNAKNSKDFKRKAEDIDYVQPREKKSKIDGNSQMFVNPNNITMEILPTNQNKHPADNQSIQVDTLTNNSKSNTSKAPIQSVGEVSTGNTITSVNHPISQDASELHSSEANNEVEEGRKETMETDEPVVDKVDNDLSVFLSNLLFTVEESHIRHMFGKCGEIETVRIIVNGVGRSKGYAYLEFKNKTSVEQALLFDRETIQGRPVFVSRCVDKKINPTKFKFPTTLDKHTLYVTNIPFEVTTEELTEVFQQCGKLKQIRIVTNRSGKSKGFAYIEYETEGDAANAIMKLDKHVMNNRPINVALSNPPARKPTKDGTVQQKSRPLIDPAGSRGRAKTQLSLLPRTIQKLQTQPKKDDKPKETNTDEPKETVSDSTDPSKNDTEKMSNSDFGKFLMK